MLSVQRKTSRAGEQAVQCKLIYAFSLQQRRAARDTARRIMSLLTRWLLSQSQPLLVCCAPSVLS